MSHIRNACTHTFLLVITHIKICIYCVYVYSPTSTELRALERLHFQGNKYEFFARTKFAGCLREDGNIRLLIAHIYAYAPWSVTCGTPFRSPQNAGEFVCITHVTFLLPVIRLYLQRITCNASFALICMCMDRMRRTFPSRDMDEFWRRTCVVQRGDIPSICLHIIVCARTCVVDRWVF